MKLPKTSGCAKCTICDQEKVSDIKINKDTNLNKQTNAVLFSENYNLIFQDDIVKCDSYIYDKETFTDTLVMEHNLVCDAEWKQNVMGSFVSCFVIFYIYKRFRPRKKIRNRKQKEQQKLCINEIEHQTS